MKPNCSKYDECRKPVQECNVKCRDYEKRKPFVPTKKEEDMDEQHAQEVAELKKALAEKYREIEGLKAELKKSFEESIAIIHDQGAENIELKAKLATAESARYEAAKLRLERHQKQGLPGSV